MQLFSMEDPIQGLLPFAMQWVGITHAELFPVDHLPADLPDALKKVYQIAKSKLETLRLFQKQNYLFDVNDLRFYEDRVVFVSKNQSAWTCETEIDKADPPVYVNRVQQKADKGETEQIHAHVSAFLTTFVLEELTLSSQYVFSIDDLEVFEEKSLTIEPLWLNAPHVWGSMKLQFYLVNQLILVMLDEDSSTGFAATNSKEMYDLLSEIAHELW